MDDHQKLFHLLSIEVPFGKYQGFKLGDVPTKYLDSEVVKWSRTLFVRQCEQAMDLVFAATQMVSRAIVLPPLPSGATLSQFVGLMFNQDGYFLDWKTHLEVAKFDRQQAFLSLVSNGIEEETLRQGFYGLLQDIDPGARQKAFYRAKKAAIDAFQIEVVHGFVIDLRPGAA